MLDHLAQQLVSQNQSNISFHTVLTVILQHLHCVGQIGMTPPPPSAILPTYYRHTTAILPLLPFPAWKTSQFPTHLRGIGGHSLTQSSSLLGQLLNMQYDSAP